MKKSFKIIGVVLVVFALLLGGYHGISSIITHNNYNPGNEEKFIDNEDLNWEFGTLLSIYIDMSYSGVSLVNEHYDGECDYTDKGFGNYEFYSKLQNSYEDLKLTNPYNVIFNINQSKLTYEELDEENWFETILNEFVDIENSSSQLDNIVKKDNNLYKEINDLPDSALVDISISFNKKKSASDIISYINDYDNSTLTYLVLGFEEDHFYGMSLNSILPVTLTKEAIEKYPNLYIESEDTLSEALLQQNYLSRLQLLMDHQDFIDLIKESSLNKNIDTLEERYNNVENEFSVYGIRGLFAKKDLISLISENESLYIQIHDVVLSSFNN